MSQTYSKTRTLVECALMIALGTVLANIKIYSLANGGSVTVGLSNMLYRERSRKKR